MEKKQKIMLVDDEFINRMLFKELLILYDYEVVTAPGGKEVLELIRQHNIDVILLDIFMPEMSGFEVCEILKNDPETNKIPIIMLTALADDRSRKQAFEAGAVGYLTKPVGIDKIIDEIERVTKPDLPFLEINDIQHNNLQQRE